MTRKYLILIILLLLKISSYSQINQSSVGLYSAQAKERILNYFAALNLLSGDKLENAEKGEIIFQTINDMFENEQVYVTNDIDLTGTTQKDFKIKDCLENIRLFYANSEVAFSIDSMKVSDVYKANNFYFVKVEVFREMIVTFNNKPMKDHKDLDFYVKFVPGLFDCQIYSIKLHEDNLDQFAKARISNIGTSIAAPVVITTPTTPSEIPPLVDSKAKVDSLKLLNELIIKQSHKQTFWLVSTIVSAGTGGYFMVASNKKYDEYLNSTNSHAADLRGTSELYNKIGIACLGLAGVCAVEFTLQTIKKGKNKSKLKSTEEKLKVYSNGTGLGLSYRF